MTSEQIRKILENVHRGQLPIEEALTQLRDLPYEDLGFAKIDHHRSLRLGIPEIIWGENKSISQISDIMRRMMEKQTLILVSRVDAEKGKALLTEFPRASYHSSARLFSLSQQNQDSPKSSGKILILAAGTSDLPVSEEAAETAALLGNEVERIYDVGVSGLHRLMSVLPRLREASVLIVVAGMEGALPSVVAGLVGKPIIAVPTSIGYGTGLGGIAALLAMLNGCAPGVTVVNIDNGIGAAVAAHLINRE